MQLKLVACAVVVLVLALPGAVKAGGMKAMTDQQLDQVTAQGVGLNINLDPQGNGVGFSFNLGQVLGNGSVVADPTASTPSDITFNGGANLSNSQFIVQNLIFNFNLCVQCQASQIIQLGLGTGVTVQPQP